MVQVGAFKLADLSGVSKRDIQIPTRDGESIRAALYHPESGPEGPLLVYFHGGGFVLGFAEMYEAGFEVLTKELGFTVVSVDYRMAPEHTFPTAAHDSIDTIHWLGADLSKGFLVSGDSSGANLAAVVAHEAVDSGLSPPITGVFLRIPLLVHPDAVPEQYRPYYNSWEEYKDGLILDQKASRWFNDQYKSDPTSGLFSPLIWPSGHNNHPPTYFQLCGMDPLRDDGLIYEYVLREEYGVPTKMDVYAGMPHGGTDFYQMLPVHGKSMKDMKAGIEWILKQRP
ncbi:alpha/beta-hydrolase [Lentithecium fluviatile CBS 122367]|uniref:Alpha/beta-hydrolase n=1 Tax=Lentithecium fluviatile CBS 122367 TaxID=1168545 RepID=A0A6G1ICP4_9PLEO|nr:alpha/beta-hydrolase [Lentithecium fluviatile CBS 122367]